MSRNPGSRQALAGLVVAGLMLAAGFVATAPAIAAASPPSTLSTVARPPALLAAQAQAATLKAQTPIGGAVTVAKKKAATVTRAQRGEGVIRITTRVCGNADNWRTVAAVNQIYAPKYRVLLGQKLTVPCTRVTTTARATTPARSVTVNKANPVIGPKGWVNPLGRSVRGISCWGAARLGHSHAGVDLPARSGTKIRAAHAGTVVLIRYQVYYVHGVRQGAGHYVVLNNGGGTYTVYMHMKQRTFLKLGQKVKAGQTIGYVGMTGGASGPHLHFEVHRGLWHQVNPAPFMRARGASIGC